MTKHKIIDAINQMPVDRICFTALVGVGPKGNSIFVDMDFPRNSSTPELAAMLLTLIQDAEENFCRMQAAFADEPQFMIDAAIYHGSSGSPVFLYNVGTWLNREGVLQSGWRVSLLGVVWGVFEQPTDGEIHLVPAPT